MDMKNENDNAHSKERENVILNKVIDGVKIGVPAVAGIAITVIKGVPKLINLIKR